jgi:hypothetical protein
MEMFTLKPRKTRNDKKLDGRVEAHLSAILCQSPPNDKTKWELQMLSDRLIELKVVEHISVTSVRNLLKKMN